jgi:predicted lipid carrier protein YhbT
VRFVLADAGCGANLAFDGRGFRAGAAWFRPDVTIRASAADYLALALRREDPDTLFFTRRLAIEGDTDLGLIVKNALDAIDWERLASPRRGYGFPGSKPVSR